MTGAAPYVAFTRGGIRQCGPAQAATISGERLIQGFLFLCGALSILTTLGIVYELGKESLNFFTRQLWEDTNKRSGREIDGGDVTTVDVCQTGGRALQVEDIIRISDEC